MEGEVISQTVIPDPKAGEALDGSLLLPTPLKRKAPPPKKKPKGPGRGRRRSKLPLLAYLTPNKLVELLRLWRKGAVLLNLM